MSSKPPNHLSNMMANFQVSLNAFVGASEQAIASMSPPKKSSNPKSLIDRFKELAPELRCKIYNALFKGAKLTVPWNEIATSGGKQTKLSCLSIDEIIHKIDFQQAALLAAYEWCKHEAIQLLAHHTTIEFTGLGTWNNEHVNILDAVDATFLKCVTKVEMPPISFIRCDRDALPALEEVVLTHCMLNRGEQDDFSLYLDHFFNCGIDDINVPVTFAYQDYRAGVIDFEWKRKQLLHLSEEYEWKLRFVARWYPRPNHHAWYEIEFDKAALKFVNAGGVMRMSSGEMSGIKDLALLRKLDLVNTWCYICSL